MTRTRIHNLLKIGGEGGDRTQGPVARTAVFETNQSQNLALIKPPVKAMKALMEADCSELSWLHRVALSLGE